MGVDGGVPGSSGEVFAFSVRDVFSVSLDVSFGESEIEKEDFVASFVESDTEIVGFDIAVDELSVVDVLDSLDHLVDEHEDSFE